MNNAKKLTLMLVASSIMGSAATLVATSGVETIRDIYIQSHNDSTTQVVDDGVVKSSTRRVAAGRYGNALDFTKAAESTINSVVSIKSFATPRQQQFYGNDFDPFEFFFGPGFGGQGRQQQQQQSRKSDPQPMGSGSGVIISEDGYIVTNNHVIDGAEKLEVTLNDNRKFTARVIGTDPNTDIALLKISATKLTPIIFGNSDEVKVGEWVLAVGNPFGLNSSVTAGIVSAKARGINKGKNVGIESFIQHDAAVNPGNSGGALVNVEGELIGINTMIYSQTGNYAGHSFAIPSTVVKKIITDIKQYGSVQRAVLGISFTELNDDKAKENNITATTEGVFVSKVADRSAAKEAGLKEGDVIVGLNGATIKNGAQMLEEMSKLRPGDKITIKFYRDNKLKTANVTLKNDQGTTKITKSSDFTSLGCTFVPLSAQEKEELGVSYGVKVMGVKNGKFKDAGIKDGFIILDINNIRVNNQDEIEDIYNAIMRDEESDKVMFITGITTTGKKIYRAVDLADFEE
jgi:Do/DeqQ family serine protease